VCIFWKESLFIIKQGKPYFAKNVLIITIAMDVIKMGAGKFLEMRIFQI
jgi:hypothetical protein